MCDDPVEEDESDGRLARTSMSGRAETFQAFRAAHRAIQAVRRTRLGQYVALPLLALGVKKRGCEANRHLVTMSQPGLARAFSTTCVDRL